MSERSILLLLQDIEEAIAKILIYTQGYTLQQYESDSKTKEDVERNFEIIGEAASRIPEEFKLQNTHLEWRIIKDFRNVIIHHYFGIDNQIVWKTIQFQLPLLLEKIKTLREAYQG